MASASLLNVSEPEFCVRSSVGARRLQHKCLHVPGVDGQGKRKLKSSAFFHIQSLPRGEAGTTANKFAIRSSLRIKHLALHLDERASLRRSIAPYEYRTEVQRRQVLMYFHLRSLPTHTFRFIRQCWYLLLQSLSPEPQVDFSRVAFPQSLVDAECMLALISQEVRTTLIGKHRDMCSRCCYLFRLFLAVDLFFRCQPL